MISWKYQGKHPLTRNTVIDMNEPVFLTNVSEDTSVKSCHIGFYDSLYFPNPTNFTLSNLQTQLFKSDEIPKKYDTVAYFLIVEPLKLSETLPLFYVKNAIKKDGSPTGKTLSVERFMKQKEGNFVIPIQDNLMMGLYVESYEKGICLDSVLYEVDYHDPHKVLFDETLFPIKSSK